MYELTRVVIDARRTRLCRRLASLRRGRIGWVGPVDPGVVLVPQSFAKPRGTILQQFRRSEAIDHLASIGGQRRRRLVARRRHTHGEPHHARDSLCVTFCAASSTMRPASTQLRPGITATN